MKKILTIIFDGFGYREDAQGNAIKMANMENFNKMWDEYPHTTLYASEEAVGLKPGVFGNSEVGHMSIGAGRKIRLNTTVVEDFLNNEIDNNPMFLEIVKKHQTNNNKKIHIMGLLSDGDVHSHIDHILKLFKKLNDNGLKNIYFHVITDGRDTSTKSALKYIDMLQDKINEYQNGVIATVCGRYYAMDRDKKWDRTKKYYDLITRGIGVSALKIEPYINSSYEKDITDEFLKPVILNKDGLIQSGDTLIWCNYREDRARQIIDSLTTPDFSDFPVLNNLSLDVYSFLPIDKRLNNKTFMEANKVDNPLGLYLSKLGLTQARIAETEKYAHVTYFFDGTFEGKLDKCDKFLIPSPKVATYDMQPQMSSIDITKRVISCMEKDYDFILVNFANTDMVGHTGNLEASVKACMSADICLGKILEVAEDNFYKVILLSDHGNIDTMIDKEGNPCTTHSTEKVPFIITDKHIKLKDGGAITNVAPTILDYMDVAKPKEMDGSESLIIKN